MRKSFTAGLVFLFLILFSIHTFAHPGRTDANGGHWDRSNNTYHYHHGYSAHSHDGGTCPYDFDDRTGEKSGNTKTSTVKSTTTTASATNRPAASARSGFSYFFNDIVPRIIGVFLLFIEIGIPIIYLITKRIKRRR